VSRCWRGNTAPRWVQQMMLRCTGNSSTPHSTPDCGPGRCGNSPVADGSCTAKIRRAAARRLEVLRVKIFVTRLAGIRTSVLRSLHNGTCSGSAASWASGKSRLGDPEQDKHNQRRPTHKFCSLLHVALLGRESSSPRRLSHHCRAALQNRHRPNA